jgi:hypothetical protein
VAYDAHSQETGKTAGRLDGAFLCRYDVIPPIGWPPEIRGFTNLSDNDETGGPIECRPIDESTATKIAYTLGRVAERLARVVFFP